MQLGKLFSKKRILFILLFALLTFVGYRINFSALVGAENQFFTLFQFFGPMAGAFLGPVFGVFSVLIAEIGNYLLLGKAFDAVGILRLFPMLFAAYYFGTKKKLNVSVIIPLVCMVAFMLHPVGREVWFFSLYWLIGPIASLFKKRLFLKSLGATFTAHSVGGALWIYTVPMPAEAWIALIPVVAFERIVFALGITFSYIGVNTVLHKLETIVSMEALNINPEYVISKKLLGLRA